VREEREEEGGGERWREFWPRCTAGGCLPTTQRALLTLPFPQLGQAFPSRSAAYKFRCIHTHTHTHKHSLPNTNTHTAPHIYTLVQALCSRLSLLTTCVNHYRLHTHTGTSPPEKPPTCSMGTTTAMMSSVATTVEVRALDLSVSSLVLYVRLRSVSLRLGAAAGRQLGDSFKVNDGE
jgi:hypothetical protein